ncbi:MAG TPA: DUF4838 domain-containing protein [Gammaproteobacteria bacterium]|nr:DUF4838 domain-containing protein [Gammaproteobacteria bacterium]
MTNGSVNSGIRLFVFSILCWFFGVATAAETAADPGVLSYSLPSGQWRQISLPCAPAGEARLGALFGDNLPGRAGERWAVFSFDTQTNRYRQLGLDDELFIDKGYWIIQITGASLTLDYQGACAGGCSLSQASAAHLLAADLWHYDPDARGYVKLTDEGRWRPWWGYWAAALPAAHGLDPRLVVTADAPPLSDYPVTGHIDGASRNTDDPGDQRLVEQNGAAGAPLMALTTRVAERIRDSHPDATVLGEAYLWSLQPPSAIDFPDNAGVSFAPIEADWSKPLNQGPINAPLADALRGWTQRTGHIWTWLYATNFGGYLQPLPTIEPMIATLRSLSTLPEVEGVMLQDSYILLAFNNTPFRVRGFSSIARRKNAGIVGLRQVFATPLSAKRRTPWMGYS